MTKIGAGNFFEDFRLGQTIRHATPRTVTTGDVALYTGLFGGRFAVQSSSTFAKAIGYRDAPIDDLLTFHVVFGKSVPDISLNAVANLGYAGSQFLAPVFAGDIDAPRMHRLAVLQSSAEPRHQLLEPGNLRRSVHVTDATGHLRHLLGVPRVRLIAVFMSPDCNTT